MHFESTVEIAKALPKDGFFWDFTCLRYRGATPEEHVRFGLIWALQKDYGYRPLQITTEAPLWFEGRYSYRADIVVWRDTDQQHPFMLLEAKAPSVGLTDDHFDKLIAYSRCFKKGRRPRLLVLTNARRALVWDSQANQALATIPTMQQAVEGFHNIPALPPPKQYLRPERSPYELSPARVCARFAKFDELQGVDLETEVKRAYLCLYELFLDEQINLACRKDTFAGYRIAEDHGVRWSSFGNASGGRFYLRCRHVQLVTPEGAARNFCLSISKYARNAQQTKADCLALIGGIDGKQALQVQSDSDRHVLQRDHAKLMHRGRISLGEGGAVKQERVLQFAEQHAPELFQDNALLACELGAQTWSESGAWRLALRLGALSDVLARLRTEVRMERRAV